MKGDLDKVDLCPTSQEKGFMFHYDNNHARNTAAILLYAVGKEMSSNFICSLSNFMPVPIKRISVIIWGDVNGFN